MRNEEELKSDFKKIRETHSVKYLYTEKAKKELANFLKDVEEFINNTYIFKTPNELFSYFENNIKLPKCKVCGKTIPFKRYSQRKKGQTEFCCSKECKYSKKGRELWKEKVSQTTFEKYGTRTYMQSDDFKEKTHETILKKYGVGNVSQNAAIKQKKEQTFLKNYGTTNIFSSEIGKQKIKNFFITNYGVDSGAKVKEIREKTKKTCFKKYNGPSFLSSPLYIRKTLDTQYDILLKKLKEDHLEALFSKEEYKGVNNSENNERNIYRFRCKDCGREFTDSLHTGYTCICPFCKKMHSRSSKEKEVANFISSFCEIRESDRSILNGKEIDIYIPSMKVGIEFDGIFWHSDIFLDKYYHRDKSNEADKKGVRLIHIFEDEWDKKQKIVKWRLRHILKNVDKSIFARKCTVKTIQPSLGNKFLEKYHLQGETKSSIFLGLFYKTRLIAVMSFAKPRFTKKYNWELTRYATIFSFNVIGGAGKLLSFFEKNFKGSIISYADKRWSNGELYRTLGFTENKDSNISYWYVKNLNRYNRVMFQKHKLKNILPIYNESDSEKVNMLNNGFIRIWDCGNKVFTKNTCQ